MRRAWAWSIATTAATLPPAALGGACASIVGIEDIVLVTAEGGAAADAPSQPGRPDASGLSDGGSTGSDAHDGSALECVEQKVLESCSVAGGVRGKGDPGALCTSGCFCAADFCVKENASGIGTCGAGRACDAPCSADHDCASLSCDGVRCR